MNEPIIGIALVGTTIIAAFLVAYVIAAIVNFCFDSAEKARRRRHPEFFRLVSLYDEKMRESIRFYNSGIAPKKRQIDAIVREWNYYTAKERSKKEEELEWLRQEIRIAKTIKETLEGEAEKIRNEITIYVKKNDLEWARQLGWE